jgi:hypothetical protein
MTYKFDYRVLSGASAASLEEQVIDLSKEGYSPQGGVDVSIFGTRLRESYLRGKGMVQETDILFSQAMIKVTEVTE